MVSYNKVFVVVDNIFFVYDEDINTLLEIRQF